MADFDFKKMMKSPIFIFVLSVIFHLCFHEQGQKSILPPPPENSKCMFCVGGMLKLQIALRLDVV